MKIFEGTVVSNIIQKTAIVEVTRWVAHPLYKKLLKRTKRYKVSPGKLSVLVGDKVKIAEIRPMAKGKHFKVIGVIGKKPAATASNAADAETRKKAKTQQKLSVSKKFSASVVARKKKI